MTDGVRAATDVVAQRLGKLKPRAAIVLGSGLAGVADAVRDAVRIPYKEIPGFPEPGAPGHKGELVAGTLEGVPVVVQSGRFHLYEGHPLSRILEHHERGRRFVGAEAVASRGA